MKSFISEWLKGPRRNFEVLRKSTQPLADEGQGLSHTLSTDTHTHTHRVGLVSGTPPNPRSPHLRKLATSQSTGPWGYTVRKTSPQPCSSTSKAHTHHQRQPGHQHLPVATRWRQHHASLRLRDWPRPKEGVLPRPSSHDLRIHLLGHICVNLGTHLVKVYIAKRIQRM